MSMQAEVVVQGLRDADIPVRTRAGSGLLDRGDVKAALRPLSRSERPLSQHLGDLRPDPDRDAGDEDANPRDADRAAAFDRLRVLADEFLALEPAGTASGFSGWLHSQARAADDDSANLKRKGIWHERLLDYTGGNEHMRDQAEAGLTQAGLAAGIKFDFGAYINRQPIDSQVLT